MGRGHGHSHGHSHGHASRSHSAAHSRGRTTYHRSYARRHHSSSHGGGAAGTYDGEEVSGQECTKESFTVPMIIMLVLFIVSAAVLGIVFAVIPINSGYICENIYAVSIGEQAYCYPGSEEDTYFYSDSVTAYRYTYDELHKLPTEHRNISFSATDTIEGGKDFYFKMVGCPTETLPYHSAHLHYTASSPVNIYVISEALFRYYLEDGEPDYPKTQSLQVTNWEYDLERDYNGYVAIVKNPNKSPVVLTQEGWVSTTVAILSESDVACKPGQECILAPMSDARILLQYNGTGVGTAPVTLLTHYGFNLELLSFVTIFPILCAFSLFLFILFAVLRCVCKSRSELEALEAKTTPGAPMECVAVGAGPETNLAGYPPAADPTGYPPAGYPLQAPPAGITPEGAAAPPPPQYSNPQDPGVMPYPGQEDLYGIQAGTI